MPLGLEVILCTAVHPFLPSPVLKVKQQGAGCYSYPFAWLQQQEPLGEGKSRKHQVLSSLAQLGPFES